MRYIRYLSTYQGIGQYKFGQSNVILANKVQRCIGQTQLVNTTEQIHFVMVTPNGPGKIHTEVEVQLFLIAQSTIVDHFFLNKSG